MAIGRPSRPVGVCKRRKEFSSFSRPVTYTLSKHKDGRRELSVLTRSAPDQFLRIDSVDGSLDTGMAGTVGCSFRFGRFHDVPPVVKRFLRRNRRYPTSDPGL
ncbi:hypothetical protein KM043_017811 [Ampulex compressa]|nr:hypothetical protein KM043_017811 [Ampulex compressa]